MTAAKRRSAPAPSPAVSEKDRQAIALREFREDLSWWIGSNPRTALRVMRLVEEVVRDPFVGTGKPEGLKHGKPGSWSRRITDSDRLVYRVHGGNVYFLGARWHYSRR